MTTQVDPTRQAFHKDLNGLSPRPSALGLRPLLDDGLIFWRDGACGRPRISQTLGDEAHWIWPYLSLLFSLAEKRIAVDQCPATGSWVETRGRAGAWVPRRRPTALLAPCYAYLGSLFIETAPRCPSHKAIKCQKGPNVVRGASGRPAPGGSLWGRVWIGVPKQVFVDFERLQELVRPFESCESR